MFTTKRLFAALSFLMVASMLLASCQTAPQTVIVTQIVQEIVTQEVEVETIVTQEVFVTQEVEVPAEPTTIDPYTIPHPILGDLRVRQAIAHCTNKLDLVKSVYPTLTEEQQAALVMNTFIPRDHWAYAGDENITIYDFDPAAGMALLDEAGWILEEGSGQRFNADGDILNLQFTTTSAVFRQTWAAVFEQQMADCGITIVRLHAPASWWFGDTTGLARRDFELGAFAWVGQADPGGLTLWACDQIPLPSNGWEGQNSMGWCNEAASVGIKAANNTLVREDRIANFLIVQQEYTKDVPAVPLFNRQEAYAYSPALQNFKPGSGEEYYNWNAYEWAIEGEDTIVMGFTQEPASLFSLVESAWVANLAHELIGYRTYTSLDYTYEPLYLTALPTIESGLGMNNDVEVKEGDMVADVAGEIVALANGVKVYDSTGAEVEFTGTPVTMKQLVLHYEYLPGLTWSDGELVKAADFELGWKIDCDPTSGATSFTTCEWIADASFFDAPSAGYDVTLMPGIQYPEYFLPWFTSYPSHQVLSDGRVLADVPAAEWQTLPEMAEMPIGWGPYVLDEWVKGEKMVFSANPFFVFGPPATPNFVISFLTAENAEAQLLGGQIDFLGAESLAGITETLAAEAAAGNVMTLVVPSATWEHIDFNLFVR